MKKHYRHETDCLNCRTELQGNFCHKCGQENLEMKESFGHMLNHAVSDYFHFDYQFFHTLKPLFAKPGKLTVDYLAGRRMQYLHPVKMYIFISLVFFVLFFHENGKNMVHVNKGKQSGKALKDTVKANILGDIDKDGSLSADEKKRAKRLVTTYLPGATETATPNAVEAAKPKGAKAATPGESEGDFNFLEDGKGAKTYEEYVVLQSKLPESKRDGMFSKYFIKKKYDWKSQGKNAQEIFTEGLKHNAPKMMFVLLPLFALILKLAFWRNHKLYVEHIIYAIHLHCFIFLFLTFTLLLQMILPHSWKEPVMGWVGFLTTVGIIWYVYRSFRVVYNRSRWRTVSKMFGVSLMYLLASTFSIFLFILITVLTSV
ncbi:DUF3667 domain-containing protein [Mucilaginibacter sp.]|uniref:DUF3667 domain-containing protein n=1 Tax=Mucilaginibacter sp. TaxID=1882438 RepID=UPI00326690DA